MSEAPERIWLQWHGDGDPGEVYVDEVTWCLDHIFDGDIEYVRKDRADALAEALETISEAYAPSNHPEEVAQAALAAYTVIPERRGPEET